MTTIHMIEGVVVIAVIAIIAFLVFNFQNK